MPTPTTNKSLSRWVEDLAAHLNPSAVEWCTGSEEENQRLLQLLVDQQTLVPLPARPNSFLARSDPNDVARVEDRTFICSTDEADAGPTNNWCDPDKMKAKLGDLFKGCMTGRTMYVVPFSMGPGWRRYVLHRRGDHRFALRRRQYADYDAHGRCRAGSSGR